MEYVHHTLPFLFGILSILRLSSTFNIVNMALNILEYDTYTISLGFIPRIEIAD